MKRFEGRTAAITGAARGIGLATARRFAREGGNVAIIDMDIERARQAAERISQEGGTRVLAVAANIADRSDVERAYTQIRHELAAPDVFVNCAAITDDKLFVDSTPADWQRIISVDLYGALNCMHVFLAGMLERQRGRMVFLASDSARIGQARLSYYAAAKAGVIALVKSVAQEVGRANVTLNVISPGATNTEMRIEREAGLLQQMGPEKYERRQKAVLKMYPAGRIGEPDDIAAGILFLSSDDAAWITGQVLSVNGGFAMV
jgi:NAD(P)-dependent dehydrogenase (short-subunit alcohol dehydrogenase family)